MTDWRSWIRVENLVWLALFAALHAFAPRRSDAELEMLVAAAVIQVLTSRLRFFSTPQGNWTAIGLKLAVGYLLIGVTDGISSSYFLILLLPVVSAATTLGRWATAGVTALSSLAYLSFLLPYWIDWSAFELPPSSVSEIALRVLFLLMTGFLTYQLAERNRREARNYQRVAEQLADANASLQKAEEAVRRGERLAALGQLTAGLAHELRNPLGTMKNSAELLAKRVPAEDPIGRELAGFIQSEVDRTNSLITRFLQFARPFHLRIELKDVAAMLDRAIGQVERHNPPFAITFVRNYDPGVPAAEFDAELMEQVFVNLLMNAAQASPADSVVTLKTRADDQTVEVAVIDRGSGIEPKNRANIFNPFFTTKQEGVGLGLAIVAKIVDEHHGHITVDSEPGQGSVFRVQIPRRQEQNGQSE